MKENAEAVFAVLIHENDEATERIQVERRRLDAHQRQLLLERYGLELALARLRGHAPPPAPVTPEVTGHPPMHDASDWQTMKRADAIERVISEAARPVNRRAIQEALADRGRDDDLTGVSSTLAHLRRYNRVEKVGTSGEWRIVSHVSHPSSKGGEAIATNGYDGAEYEHALVLGGNIELDGIPEDAMTT